MYVRTLLIKLFFGKTVTDDKKIAGFEFNKELP